MREIYKNNQATVQNRVFNKHWRAYKCLTNTTKHKLLMISNLSHLRCTDYGRCTVQSRWILVCYVCVCVRSYWSPIDHVTQLKKNIGTETRRRHSCLVIEKLDFYGASKLRLVTLIPWTRTMYHFGGTRICLWSPSIISTCCVLSIWKMAVYNFSIFLCVRRVLNANIIQFDCLSIGQISHSNQNNNNNKSRNQRNSTFMWKSATTTTTTS